MDDEFNLFLLLSLTDIGRKYLHHELFCKVSLYINIGFSVK